MAREVVVVSDESRLYELAFLVLGFVLFFSCRLPGSRHAVVLAAHPDKEDICRQGGRISRHREGRSAGQAGVVLIARGLGDFTRIEKTHPFAVL